MTIRFLLRSWVAASVLWVSAWEAQATDITGAGSTFVYPVCAKWAEGFRVATQNSLNYQSIGSGGGIKQVKAKVVDFGATDKPLTREELNRSSLVQWPLVVGGVVPVINVEGIAPGQMKLDGPVLADIYLGKIKRWNDPAIQALNKGLNLPARDIVVVSRTDGSGTTFIFTNYLSKVSAEWKNKVGSDTAVRWPTGINGKGNEGVASYVRQQAGGIGYVEYAYALQNKMSHVQMKNHEGQFVEPDIKTFSAAASNANWKPENGFYEVLTDEPGKNSWPITGATFVLMQKVQENPEHAKTALRFFEWAYKNGQKAALSLDYVPLPDDVARLIEAQWKMELKDSAGKALY
ncbi:phosphate ABC transporter substrate-binding protein PstS [Ferrovum myxofaciens]|jgi:phosphate transport system substrate-binding protein|uniref:Phosphate-binding protein PstS n=2 Tax=root TaxID=1 RepID=A0A8F3E120_9PROT|nr:phosphate ABC transporter substrate-binding protein PstS [Ferrovum myxofaciens]MBW8029140.1 phosphate ABC transporter substrate-binding protein PstS [Ferrovum sp.]KXW59319.1 phosphate-binding protein PstS precursor [Ferrovum myxofaciens]MBU6995144.1 phosphate ABC transporter substrate-binding protein PstS [Ferrovum myxofaciens]QKE38927.1 MAG: phosphate ABC transporter substrate-binding protein PstS [Ferrovum myxofaciens]QKE41520.1 MAG: phosphate ABC transporter substrate-binding protein Pst